MPNDLNITPERALEFLNSIIKRADDDRCEINGLCPLYDFCCDEVCVTLRKALLNANDSSKEEVKG